MEVSKANAVQCVQAAKVWELTHNTQLTAIAIATRDHLHERPVLQLYGPQGGGC